MNTTVVNLFGGPGVGKSTLACGLFYFMKIKHLNAELVREYVKAWAWESRPIGEYDQFYISGKQAKYESLLYNKVEFLITDCPIILSPIYESFAGNDDPVTKVGSFKFMKQAEAKGIKYKNYVLARDKNVPYDVKGRYNSIKTAGDIDKFMQEKLSEWEVPFTLVDCKYDDRINFILNDLEIK